MQIHGSTESSDTEILDVSFDDDYSTGHLDFSSGQCINDRYRVTKLLGQGCFGRVFEIVDLKDNSIRAIKIIKSGQSFAGKREEEILRYLGQQSSDMPIITLYDTFYINMNYCLVIDRLGQSLYDLLVKNEFKGLDLEDIKYYAYQALLALRHLHVNGITHTDVKPENLLFCEDSFRYDRVRMQYRPRNLQIKLIDFNAATMDSQYHTPTINTRNYRSPEVILLQSWDQKSDIWSLGCLLVELYTGNLLFPVFDDYTHLALIEKRLGRIPLRMTRNCVEELRDYFNDFHQLNWPELANSRKVVKRISDSQPVKDLIKPADRDFADFVHSMLRIYPDRRASADEALRHSFLMI